jgi:hypothetical protein
MKAPKYERAELIGAAMQEALDEFDEPIEKIEFVLGKIIVSTRTRSLVLNYSYKSSCDPDGVPMPGSGSWNVSRDPIQEFQGKTKSGLRALFSWLQRK